MTRGDDDESRTDAEFDIRDGQWIRTGRNYSGGGGAFRRMLRRLTSDVDELDDENLSGDDAERSGAQRAAEYASGQEVTVLGRLRSVEYGPQDAAASLEAELFDGTEGVTLIWPGRRRIPGIEPGRTMRVRGRLALREGRKVLYNPYYEIYPSQEAQIDESH